MPNIYSYLSFKLRLVILFAILAILLSLYISDKFNSSHNNIANHGAVEATTKIGERVPGLLSVPLKEMLADNKNTGNTDSPKLTERAARNLIYTYIIAKQSGKDTKELQKLIENEVEQVLNVQIRKYKKDDLTIIKSFSKQKYKKDMRKALDPLTQITEYELESIAKYIKDNDPEALKNINNDIKLYTQTIINLLQVPIEEKLAIPHLALINAYSKLLASLQLISESKNDIMLVYPGLKLFLEADAEIYSAFDALKLYVEK